MRQCHPEGRGASRLERRSRAEAAAAEETRRWGCPCKLIGPAGDPNGPIFQDSLLEYEWEHVSNAEGRPHRATILYYNMNSHSKPISHCPMRVSAGTTGFHYTLEFFDALAENLCTGLTYQGLIYEGPVLSVVRDVPHGGDSPLDVKAYWLHPQGALKCMSARELHHACATNTLMAAAEEEADYVKVAESFGYLYLGGRCDVTNLLEEPGTMRDQRWKELPWRLPETSLSSCWWLTNPQDIEHAEATPHLLCKSVGVLRAELHRLRVATLAKIRTEVQRRQDRNKEASARLQQNSEWRRMAAAPQLAALANPSAMNVKVLAL